MSEDERYNGWANRETWAVALHINNDQGWQESVLDALREAELENSDTLVAAYGAEEEDSRWGAIHAAGEIVRENVEEVLDATSDEHRRLLYGDIGSLWRVDWTEIGAAFLSDLEEQDAYSSGRGSDEPTHNLDED